MNFQLRSDTIYDKIYQGIYFMEIILLSIFLINVSFYSLFNNNSNKSIFSFNFQEILVRLSVFPFVKLRQNSSTTIFMLNPKISSNKNPARKECVKCSNFVSP